MKLGLVYHEETKKVCSHANCTNLSQRISMLMLSVMAWWNPNMTTFLCVLPKGGRVTSLQHHSGPENTSLFSQSRSLFLTVSEMMVVG